MHPVDAGASYRQWQLAPRVGTRRFRNLRNRAEPHLEEVVPPLRTPLVANVVQTTKHRSSAFSGSINDARVRTPGGAVVNRPPMAAFDVLLRGRSHFPAVL